MMIIKWCLVVIDDRYWWHRYQRCTRFLPLQRARSRRLHSAPLPLLRCRLRRTPAALMFTVANGAAASSAAFACRQRYRITAWRWLRAWIAHTRQRRSLPPAARSIVAAATAAAAAPTCHGSYIYGSVSRRLVTLHAVTRDTSFTALAARTCRLH